MFGEKETSLKAELEQIRKVKKGVEVSDQQLEKINRKFSLMSEILDILKEGTRKYRKEIIMEFGSNLEILLIHLNEMRFLPLSFLPCSAYWILDEFRTVDWIKVERELGKSSFV